MWENPCHNVVVVNEGYESHCFLSASECNSLQIHQSHSGRCNMNRLCDMHSFLKSMKKYSLLCECASFTHVKNKGDKIELLNAGSLPARINVICTDHHLCREQFGLTYK